MSEDKGILLESGTNELELLEFVVGNQHYGINVAKISELCPYEEPTGVPNSHEFIEGIFMPRERIITVIDLAKALGIQLPVGRSADGDMYIITNFNRLHTAFHVQQVLGIHRVSWENVAKPDSTISRQGKGVAIAYDSRHMSPEFAEEAALTLAANGIKAYVFESLRPTPELSFAVRELGCISGINITASHNPPEYNGYKVYWEDGAQITPPHDTGIMDEVKAVTDYAAVKTMDKEEAKKAGLYENIGKTVDDRYMEELKKNVLHPDCIKKASADLKIVYTPLHGTGNLPVRRILKELGFKNVFVVPEQELPDGEFPTVSYPNPEAPEAFELALKLAKEKDADLVLATDPDADRLGVYVKDTKSGEYICLTGNMSGSFLADYEIGQKLALEGKLPEDGELIKTVVTSNLVDAMAKYYGIKVTECLTGFKWIGREILRMETTGKGPYLFGFEESYGYLSGTYVRDKDAVVASMLVCEMAAYYKKQGKSLAEVIDGLYEEFGYYLNQTYSFEFDGAAGMQKMSDIMTAVRDNTPKSIAGYDVVKVSDYFLRKETDVATGSVTDIDLPKSNVIALHLADDNAVIIRPSGTEPKIKLYITSVGKDKDNAAEICEKLVVASKEILGVK